MEKVAGISMEGRKPLGIVGFAGNHDGSFPFAECRLTDDAHARAAAGDLATVSIVGYVTVVSGIGGPCATPTLAPDAAAGIESATVPIGRVCGQRQPGDAWGIKGNGHVAFWRVPVFSCLVWKGGEAVD